MRRYLAEFLSDPLVVDLPRLLWLPVLHAIVLRVRPARSAEKYATIWTAEGSPLVVHTRRQADLLAARLPQVRVAWAMRYGEPSIAAGLAALAQCTERLVVPLYPQYARSTTESVRRCLPAGVSMVEHFHDHAAYIAALAAGIRRHWARHGRAERLVLSFHGLPQRAIERGDPYREHCETTARLLARALGLAPGEALVTYQSRFGPARWLEPATEPTLVALARAGAATVDVACPGFVSDCLETLEEIGIGARAAFLSAGGAELRLVPCLNEDPEWIEALAEIALDSRTAAPK